MTLALIAVGIMAAVLLAALWDYRRLCKRDDESWSR